MPSGQWHENHKEKATCDNSQKKAFTTLSYLYLWKSSFRYILFYKKKTPNDAVTLLCQSQFTPKMKANAVSRLLLSLVWIDHYDQCIRLTALIIFGQNTLPANIRKWVFSWNKRDGITWRNYKFAWNSWNLFSDPDSSLNVTLSFHKSLESGKSLNWHFHFEPGKVLDFVNKVIFAETC